jgi:predicted DNA-binding transcriptional regulator AlpA
MTSHYSKVSFKSVYSGLIDAAHTAKLYTDEASSTRSGSQNGQNGTAEGALSDTHSAAPKLLRFPAVHERTRLSRSTIWPLERQGAFSRHHPIQADAAAGIETTSPIGSDRSDGSRCLSSLPRKTSKGETSDQRCLIRSFDRYVEHPQSLGPRDVAVAAHADRVVTACERYRSCC